MKCGSHGVAGRKGKEGLLKVKKWRAKRKHDKWICMQVAVGGRVWPHGATACVLQNGGQRLRWEKIVNESK